MNIIQPNTVVRINAPDASGVHGKTGTVQWWNPKTGRYAVSMPAYRGALSYVGPNELIVLTVPDTHNEEVPPLDTSETLPMPAPPVAKWVPKFVYHIYDPKQLDCVPVEEVHADTYTLDGTILIFRDDRGVLVSMHHLAPGCSFAVTDRDGYTMQEKRGTIER